MQIISIDPTVFFVYGDNALRQLVRLTFASESAHEDLVLRVTGQGIDEMMPLGAVPQGTVEREIYLPDLYQPLEIWFGVYAGRRLLAEQTLNWQPQKHWEVHLVHYSHHDMGYTDLLSKVVRQHAVYLEQVVAYCEETQAWPDDVKFRYLIEQAWSVLHFVETRPPEIVERFMHFARQGQIEITALFGNQTLELCGHEELIRLLYPAFRLKRDYGIEIVSAEHNDIPGIAWGLAGVLTGAGIRYFSPGIPAWYFGTGEERVHPMWDEEAVLPMVRPGAFWWEGTDGSRVLFWHDMHGRDWHPTSYAHALRELPDMLRTLDSTGYEPDVVSYTVRGATPDNTPPLLRYADIAKAWNERWAYPKLISSTNRIFLDTFSAQWGHTLNTLRGDIPGTDYGVAAISTPQETAINRNSHDWLLTAEKLMSMAALIADYDYPQSEINEAYHEIFCFDCHCWGMSQPGGPAQDANWAEKGTFAYRGAALAHNLMVKASNRIADVIHYPDEGTHLILFNSLSWERNEIVRVPLRMWQPHGKSLYWRPPQQAEDGPTLAFGSAVGRAIFDPPLALFENPFQLIDIEKGESIPYQLVNLVDAQAASPWAAERFALGKIDPRYLYEVAFQVEHLPAMGYKSYRIVPCREWPQFESSVTVGQEYIDNALFRVEFDAQTGQILSIYDKELGEELVDANAPHGFAQLLSRQCETGEIEPGRTTHMYISEHGPLYTTLRSKGEGLGCPQWTQEMILYHTEKRIDVNARILRDSIPMLEMFYAFPFRVPSPQFRFEAVDAIIEPLQDQLPGTNSDYYAVQHWAEIHNDGWGITWTSRDAPMVEFGGLWPGYVSSAHHGVTPPGYGHPFLQPGELQQSHLYSLFMHNNFRTNFINVHTGEILLRYSFTSHEGDWRAGRARNFGWGVSNPPLPVWMSGAKAGSLPPATSFCQIDAANVMLLTFKRAEDGRGYILRFIETEGRDTEVNVEFPFLSISEAYESNLVEEDQSRISCNSRSVTTRVPPSGIRTVRVIIDIREH
ncbi:MAG: hypothetical protein KF893_02165 [Caldilineaceae bacterium]|nr:hypothetical protein [Caldilineaceae bacterium]